MYIKKHFKTLFILIIFILIYFTYSNYMLSNKLSDNNKYLGNWPTNANFNEINGPTIDYDCKDTIKEIGCNCFNDNDCINENCVKYPNASYCSPKNGDIFPNFVGLDQYNQEVSLYDFSFQNKYVLIELATSWCNACKTLAEWISNDNMNITSKRWWKDDYYKIKQLIKNDKIYYITILYENNERKSPDYVTSKEWFMKYPDKHIPILVDRYKNLHKWVKPTGIPTAILLNDKMEIVNFATRGINSSFDELLKIIK